MKILKAFLTIFHYFSRILTIFPKSFEIRSYVTYVRKIKKPQTISRDFISFSVYMASKFRPIWSSNSTKTKSVNMLTVKKVVL